MILLKSFIYRSYKKRRTSRAFWVMIQYRVPKGQTSGNCKRLRLCWTSEESSQQTKQVQGPIGEIWYSRNSWAMPCCRPRTIRKMGWAKQLELVQLNRLQINFWPLSSLVPRTDTTSRVEIQCIPRFVSFSHTSRNWLWLHTRTLLRDTLLKHPN